MAYASYQHNPSTRGNGRQRGISGLNEGLYSSPIQILSPPIHEFETTGSIENAEYIGSYNWVENDGRTIIVPGSPPVWTNRALPYTIPSDAEIRPADYHIPSSALLPLMKAVDIVGREIDWPAVDFVTDRNNLRKLTRWLQNGSKDRDFRIDIQLAGEHSILLNIFENRIRGNTDWRSYGESFEHETTSPARGCERSTGHHRIVKYNFFGLKMVVRFEVDACLPSDEKDAELDSMTHSLATLNVASESSWSQGLHIIHASSEVPQQSLVELKTTGSRKSIKWSEVFPQLYLSQTPWFYIGYHENGTFSELQIHKTVEMEAQRDFFEPRLRKLGQMLKTIQELVVAHGTKTRLSLVCQGGALSLYERVTMENCLPAEELARFDVD